MSVLRVAGIGAGYFSQFHYDAWARIPAVSLVGVCDRDLSKAEATAVPAYNDLTQMLAEVRPDLLDVVLPPVAQAAAIRTALATGIKTIICQKPFCRDLAEAEAITSEAKQAGTTLIIHENFRFQPWYRALKSMLEAGEIGELHQLTFRLRPGDGQGPHAYLDRQPYFQKMPRFLVHETGVHWIDTFRYLLGNPTALYADLRQVNPALQGEDAGFVLFDHPQGVRAMFDANRHLDHAALNHRCTMGEALVEGTKGTLALRGDGSLWHRPFGEVDVRCRREGTQASVFGGDCVFALQAHVVSALMDGTALENEAAEYLDVIRIEETIYRSAELGQKLTLDL